MPETPTVSNLSSTQAVSPVPGLTPHYYPQMWLFIVSFALFGVYVAWDLNFLKPVFVLDRSYLTFLITALVVLSSGHAVWHIVSFSRHVEQARRYLSDTESIKSNSANSLFIDAFLTDINLHSSPHGKYQNDSDTNIIVEILADKLRSPVDLGWFMVDLAVRMGLVGTIIGFILIFTSLSGDAISGTEGLKELLVVMSGGMGTALFTTLCGLVGATLLSLQYLILGREVECLIGLMVRIDNRHSVQRSQ